jgi:hypothetical protein
MRRGTWAAAALVAVATVLWSSGVSVAHPGHEIGGPDGIVNTKGEVYHNQKAQQHGSPGGHLPRSRQGVALLSKVELTTEQNRVSDIAFNNNTDTAYLGKWAAGASPPACTGGVWPVRMTDPTSPVRRPFMSSHRNTYVTEGVQVIHDVNTASFTGDILVLSNETCGPGGVGGLTLWDVTNPNAPVKLSEGVGDFMNPDGSVDPIAHDAHSAMAWQDGANVYVIAIDNDDDNAGDLDFFDITNPTAPVWLSETGIDDWPDAEVNAYGDFPTSHDFDVRNIGGTWYAMVSYWDAGWVLLNVDDPTTPTFVDDSNYLACDPVNPACPPEGNGHQGEWDFDGDTFLGTDEDQSAFRLITTITEGPHAGEYDAGEFSWTTDIVDEPDQSMNGPTIFGGYGCPDDRATIPTAEEAMAEHGITLGPNEDLILVTQRGPVQDPNKPTAACFFSEKVDTAQQLGYDGAIVANHHVGAGGDETGAGAFPDAFICGSQGHQFTPMIPGVCIGHRQMHLQFDDPTNADQTYPPDYTVPYPVGDPGDVEPDIGDQGWDFSSAAVYDGWGYVRLLDADEPGLPELDQMAIAQTNDPAFAQGFGDMSVHEVAVELYDEGQEQMAYFSWYDAGFRVGRFDDDSIDEVGHFIDRGGNDFWGVQITDQKHLGRRVVVASDRDFGLYVFKYTGALNPRP